jgi:integrase/recombinase XerC
VADLAIPVRLGQLTADRPARRLVDAFFKGRKASTIRAYEKDLAVFRDFLGVEDSELAVEQLLRCTPGDANALVLEYRSHLLDEKKVHPATVNRRLASLRSMVKLARTIGLVTWSIEIEGLKVDPYRDTRGPGLEAIGAMLECLKKRTDPKGARDRAILRLLYDLGLRRGEICSLDVEHVDFARGINLLGKGKRIREWFSLPEFTAEALAEWLEVRGDEPGPLFTSLDHRSYGHRITGSALYEIVRNLGKTVGTRARPHGIRHTAITTSLDLTDGNKRAGQAFGRHARGDTTDRYDDNRRDIAGETARLVSEKLGR